MVQSLFIHAFWTYECTCICRGRGAFVLTLLPSRYCYSTPDVASEFVTEMKGQIFLMSEAVLATYLGPGLHKEMD